MDMPVKPCTDNFPSISLRGKKNSPILLPNLSRLSSGGGSQGKLRHQIVPAFFLGGCSGKWKNLAAEKPLFERAAGGVPYLPSLCNSAEIIAGHHAPDQLSLPSGVDLLGGDEPAGGCRQSRGFPSLYRGNEKSFLGNQPIPMEDDLFLLQSPREEDPLLIYPGDFYLDYPFDGCPEPAAPPGNLPRSSEAGGRPSTSSPGTLSRRSNSFFSLRDRLGTALRNIREAYRGCDALIQVWMPTHSGGGLVLTTSSEPYALDPRCERLINYRTISAGFNFSAEENSEGQTLGLPGRVFVGKLPEWSPDVRFFSEEEYPRVGYARQCDVRGSLGVPVFQRGGQTCLGVIEVIMTTERMNYRSDYDLICGALQAMDLSSSWATCFPRGKVTNDPWPGAFPEIAAALMAGCEVNGFALAQAWIPLGSQRCEGMKDEPCCVSMAEDLFWVKDQALAGFHEACLEHHLFRGQGIVGKALVTNRPWFCADIGAMSKTEYPLAHHARVFGLGGAAAVCLRRGVDPGRAEIVLEFIFPRGCRRTEEQAAMVNALLVTLRQACPSWRLIAAREGSDESLPTEESCEESLSGGGLPGDAGEMAMTRRPAKAEKIISLEELRQYFSGSLKEAAKGLGVCPTTLKRICRQHGISRWPGRKIRKVGSSLRKLQVVIDSVQGVEGAMKFTSLYEDLPKASIMVEEETGKSVVTSLYQSEDAELPNSVEARLMEENGGISGSKTPSQNKPSQLRMKAMHGEDNIRFTLKPNWGALELKQMITKRFNIRDMNSVDLKYLDEDSEWIFLRCDEDLEECTKLYRTGRIHTIKVSVHPTLHPGSTTG